ncbi:hypothetical protein C5167_024149 [Papaver somniferum]|uniref:Uncharacterized protein n=1 Tax=Papaver somniferum TaxID=3469 RepID=A0A4Y7JMQ8_PAPSO|nr:hypothetical protein C5167_024149 [Papaver somniferum]
MEKFRNDEISVANSNRWMLMHAKRACGRKHFDLEINKLINSLSQSVVWKELRSMAKVVLNQKQRGD